MTFGFFYLAAFLLGFTLALVGGLVRRILHPSELCAEVVVPSHEHWASLHTPRSDLAVSFLMFFGLAAFLLHGFTHMTTRQELLAGAGIGLIGALVLRLWSRTVCDPTHRTLQEGEDAVVVRSIPEVGYGQIEVGVSGSRVRLAARSGSGSGIATGTPVRVLDLRESVVVVVPK